MRSMHKTLLLPVCAAIVLAMALAVSPAFAGSSDGRSGTVLRNWYRLTLELVRHTPTYSPPVASRSFAYLGIAAFEVVASGDAGLVTLSGQLNAMPPMPQRDHGSEYDDAVALQAAMSAAVRELFGNTGPTDRQDSQAFARLCLMFIQIFLDRPGGFLRDLHGAGR